MSNAELIAEVRNTVATVQNLGWLRNLLGDMADALEAADRDLAEWTTSGAPAWVAAKDRAIAEAWAERDEAREQLAEASEGLAAAQAVIAEAQSQRLDHGAQGNGYAKLVERIRRILSQSPTDALAAPEQEGGFRALSSGHPDYWCHICNRGLEGCDHEPEQEEE